MSKKMDKNLSEKFNIEAEEDVNQELTVIDDEGKDLVQTLEVIDSNDDTDTEYEFVKENIRGLLSKGEGLLDEAIKIAKDNEHPRAIEVAANLFKGLVDANQSIMDTQIKHQKIKSEKALNSGNKNTQLPLSGDVSGDVNITNIAFTGNSTDLHNIIREQNKIAQEKKEEK